MYLKFPNKPVKIFRAYTEKDEPTSSKILSSIICSSLSIAAVNILLTSFTVGPKESKGFLFLLLLLTTVPFWGLGKMSLLE